MAIFKCKMCGGDLEISEGISVIECEYCETKQTIPCVDNEKKLNLFNRANRLRMNSEFDKAAAIYENIVAEFPEEAEAYWGLCLCNYGIEYVDDPATAKKIPTCHRASFESIQRDENFELALEYADVVAQKVYRDEAREIDRIMQEILAVSKNEKLYDVFICYKETDEKGERTIDSVLAYDIYEVLTAKGYNVFFSRITLEDKLGRQYEPYIFAALNSAKVMLSVGTKYEYFHAVWVKNEWSRFLKLMAKDKSKVLIPCYKDMDAYDIPEEFKALQAQDLGKLGAVQDIVRGIEKIIPKSDSAAVKETVVVSQGGGPNVEALLKRGYNSIEDGEWNRAKDFFEQVLNMNAECAAAYLGLVMSDFRVDRIDRLADENFIDDKNYRRAKQYADNNLLCNIESIEKDYYEKKRLEDEKQRLEAEEKKRLEENRIQEEKERLHLEQVRIQEENARRRIEIKSIREQIAPGRNSIAISNCHVVGLTAGGTVVADGIKYDGRCNVTKWRNVIAVAVGNEHTVGLLSDGSVVAAGYNFRGRCDVSDWRNIIAVSAGTQHTVGVKSDGTVIATGNNIDGVCDVSNWKDIIAVSAGDGHTVGLKSNGTVVVTGSNQFGRCNIWDWTDIVEISAGYIHTVGLKSDGTVVAVGYEHDERCNVADWRNIVAIAVGEQHTVGLKSDGTVVATGNNKNGECDVSNWRNVIAISAGGHRTIGLMSDGIVKCVGKDEYSKGSITGFKLFDDMNNIESDRNQRINRCSQNLCQHCGGSFKGVLLKKCTCCGKEKDY